MARAWVGTSGWSYPNWRGRFYPRGLRPGEWIRYYASQLPSVEINATFYRLPRASMLEGWVAKTPPTFVFAAKGWRTITHYRRLADCEEPLARCLDALTPLADKLGPVLFQLPPRFGADIQRLRAFLALLPAGRRFAFEFRDPDWHQDAVYEVLAAHGCAFCPFEIGPLVSPRVVTADFVYVRLHGRPRRYRGNYDEATLADWACWLRGHMGEGRDVYVYFDNTDEADHAPRNAMRLAEMLAEPVAA